MIKYFIIQRYGKRKVKVTYMLHLRVVLVLTMVWSRQHHLRHQWSQISKFVSMNHIHHHTYFKSSYVHIQVFHILHHHTMKLLQTFGSFLAGRPIVEINIENWLAACRKIQKQKQVCCGLHNSAEKNYFAAGCTIRQQKLFRCWRHNFSSECYFVAANTFSAVNANSLQQLNSDNESQIRCRQYNFNSESQFHCRTHHSATNVNSLQTTEFQQRITNSLQTIQLWQWISISLQNTEFGSEC